MLKPFLVIVHDFPKYLSVYTDTKLFALKATSKPKIYTRVKAGMGKSYIGSIDADATARMYINAKGASKFRLDASGKTRMRNKGIGSSKLFKLSGLINKTKIKTRGRWKANIGKYKAYLDPDRYFIGAPYLLGHWDGVGDTTLLEECDDLTMQQMSVNES